MRARNLGIAFVLLSWLGGAPLLAEIELRQQFSAWFSLNDNRPSTPRFGLRFLPALSLAKTLGAGWKLDSELSLDLYASVSLADWRELDATGTITPYRLWLRLSSTRFEARLGLQKINFGSATVFRPLMWFDALDPRDPLQVTAGVYGLLLRYYFKNNANAWLWGLYGNTDPKGWETRPTAGRTPELGGRFQTPLFSGEAGLTVHQRRLDPGPTERRFALDGKWDVGVGLWAEAAFVHLDDPAALLPWQRSFALGVDYTFKLGNGLYLLAEQFFAQGAASLSGSGSNGISFTALLARYPLGMLDNLGAIFYYDWPRGRLYSFANWQRTTDNWQFHLMLFWNPRQTQAIRGLSTGGIFGGKGFQFLVVLNL
jgi:hypothetical protein